MEVVFRIGAVIIVDGLAELAVIEHQCLDIEDIIDVIDTDDQQGGVEDRVAAGEVQSQ